MIDYLFSVVDLLRLSDELIFYLFACCIIIALVEAFWYVVGGALHD